MELCIIFFHLCSKHSFTMYIMHTPYEIHGCLVYTEGTFFLLYSLRRKKKTLKYCWSMLFAEWEYAITEIL